MKLIKNYLLLIILLLGFFLRAYQLHSIPAINPDEAAIAYNAYSLLETGKDEHGNSWPIHFKSFGDYKPGGYFYLSLPFIKLLGLNALAVRLPNLILSTLTIFFLYKLVRLFSKSQMLALISSFVLTISPWHIHFSRGAWESSASLAFILIATYYFQKSIKNKLSPVIYLSVALFSLSLYTYHSARIVAPLIVLILIALNLQTLKANIGKLILPVIFGVLITLPVVFSFLNDGGAERFGGVGITADQGPIWRTNELLNHHQERNIITRLVHNKFLYYSIFWVEKYLSHFDPNFLFLTGDEVPRSKSPDFGQLYLFEILLIPLGIRYLFNKKTKSYRKFRILTVLWLLVAPLAASLTFQSPSALRSLFLVIPLTILISSGIMFILVKYPKSLLLLALTYLFFGLAYSDSYFLRSPRRYPFAWNYKFNELVPYIEQMKHQYDRVYITDKYDQPYILFLFFSKYSPSQIQQDISLTKPDQFGFQTVPTYDKYIFGHINWPDIPDNSLVVAADEIIPHGPHKIINFDNNQPAFKIYIK